MMTREANELAACLALDLAHRSATCQDAGCRWCGAVEAWLSAPPAPGPAEDAGREALRALLGAMPGLMTEEELAASPPGEIVAQRCPGCVHGGAHDPSWPGCPGPAPASPPEAPACPCQACNGTGRGVTINVACPACAGTGRVSAPRWRPQSGRGTRRAGGRERGRR